LLPPPPGDKRTRCFAAASIARTRVSQPLREADH
jgi:hypothetical protein